MQALRITKVFSLSTLPEVWSTPVVLNKLENLYFTSGHKCAVFEIMNKITNVQLNFLINLGRTSAKGAAIASKRGKRKWDKLKI